MFDLFYDLFIRIRNIVTADRNRWEKVNRILNEKVAHRYSGVLLDILHYSTNCRKTVIHMRRLLYFL